MNQLKILLLGPSLSETKGGMASVQELILQQTSLEVQIRYISTHKEGSTARKVLVFGWAIMQLLWRLLQKEVDIVHIHLAERGSVLRKGILMFIVLIFRKPVFLHAHGCEFESFYSNLPQWTRQILGWTFRQCTRFIVLSNSWRDFYVSNLGLKPEQVVVLVNPVKLPSEVPPRVGCEKINLVFLGRIGQRKGAFDLLRAFSTLSLEQKNRSHLFLAGDGDIEQAHELVESLNLKDHVSILGWINVEQRNVVLAKANVFVLPSYNEGLPMAVLEAMGWGLPIITTPVGGIPQLIAHGQNGLLINPGDIQQLSEAIQTLIDNETLRLSLGDAARTSSVPFDIKNYSSSLTDLYYSVLRDKQSKYGFKEQDRKNQDESMAMNLTPEEAQQLQVCINEIAAIFCKSTSYNQSVSLDDIKATVSQQMLEYISSQVVSVASSRLPELSEGRKSS